ncbi:MAG: hypothetical protein DWQ02_28440 [Bacteroidetes bacterium]|nr:MAG: hypothetical protein DWQ02_28440 [Bacteroidota bacterium]
MKTSFTQIPNIVFDQYLPSLKESELKILLIIIRQTYGWLNPRTGYRKRRDRITLSQFVQKTGLSRRIVSNALQSLIQKNLISITDYQGNPLLNSDSRKGKSYIFFAFKPVQIPTPTSAKSVHEPVQNCAYNKRNINKTKYRGVVRVGEVLEQPKW